MAAWWPMAAPGCRWPGLRPPERPGPTTRRLPPPRRRPVGGSGRAGRLGNLLPGPDQPPSILADHGGAPAGGPTPPHLFADDRPPADGAEAAPDPGSLGDAVPLGEAFEMGLYSLLDDESPAPGATPAAGGRPLVRRSSSCPPGHRARRWARRRIDPDAVVAGASTRSPDQVRSLLLQLPVRPRSGSARRRRGVAGAAVGRIGPVG
ncbi:MAG: hypothetical protein R2704_03120 [Microthrixaceae bacterium]